MLHLLLSLRVFRAVPVSNASIAAIFSEIADLLEIQGANVFRVLAYRNGARAVGDLGTDIDTLLKSGSLTDIPGIGADLAKKVSEILETGTCEFLQRLHQELGPSLAELLKIPGLGPRRVGMLYHNLQILNLEQLLAAAKDGRLRVVPGFGEKTEQRILDAVQARLSAAGRLT